jgi:hypothetical protein
VKTLSLCVALAIGMAVLATATHAESKPSPTANTVSMDVERAKPILESWRKSQGWAIATTKTESNGDRYVKYKIVTKIHGSISVDKRSNLLLTTSIETDWIPLRVIPMPVADGPAADVLAKAQAFLKENEAVYNLGEAGVAQRTTLPGLVETIQATVRR